MQCSLENIKYLNDRSSQKREKKEGGSVIKKKEYKFSRLMDKRGPNHVPRTMKDKKLLLMHIIVRCQKPKKEKILNKIAYTQRSGIKTLWVLLTAREAHKQ